MNREYNLAVALMQFKQAYKLLTTASKALPDLDMSEGYPFYLLDFEDITDAVCAWCSIHAAKLLRELPDKVDNPACAGCEHFRIGFGSNGLCKAAAIKNCKLYPQIIFSREQVAPFMAEQGDPVTPQQSDIEIYLKYLNVLEVLYDRKEGSKEAETNKVEERREFYPGVSGGGITSANIPSGPVGDIKCEPAIPAYLQPAGSSEFYQRVKSAADRFNQEAGIGDQSIEGSDKIYHSPDK